MSMGTVSHLDSVPGTSSIAFTGYSSAGPGKGLLDMES